MAAEQCREMAANPGFELLLRILKYSIDIHRAKAFREGRDDFRVRNVCGMINGAAMQLPSIDLMVSGFFGLCVLDWTLELCLIRLLRWRHHETWVAAGAPSASFRGLIQNSFNARNFVVSHVDADSHDPLLRAYCRFFRVFNALFLACMFLLTVAMIISGLGFLFRF